MNALTPTPTIADGLCSAMSVPEATNHFAANAHSPATRRAYRTDWAAFVAWCDATGLAPLPADAETVAGHLSQCALDGLAVSSIGRRVAAIAYAHRLAGMDSPTSTERVRSVLSGIRRAIGVAPTRKQPMTVERLITMLAALPDTLAGKRDYALLALGFAGAFRRSELVALTVADLTEVPEGLRVLIRRSKTDQTGAGQEIAIPQGFRLRAVESVQEWLAAAEITEGPVFRAIATRRLHGRGRPATELVGAGGLSGHAVAEILKRHCEDAGLDPEDFSGHSLRSGYVTSAVEANASVIKIAEVTRHKSMDMLRVYARRIDLFKDHSGEAFL